MRPRIAITNTKEIQGVRQLSATPETYAHAVTASGGLPLMIPAMAPALVPEVLATVDAVLLSGGHDVSPDLYGAALDPATGELDRARDLFEIALVKQALAAHKPILGICRGQQIINVALGGTLIQDIKSTVIKHQQRPITGTQPTHQVQVVAGTQLAGLLQGAYGVNSFHHQAVAQVAPGLKISARSSDGVIEALEAPQRQLFSVQWHPEIMYPAYPAAQRLFQAFIQQAVGIGQSAS
ncbi:gamma-glutamyl-gamma-aminobutyrate hydrolase family protein [Loigolactobacillus binensis]|uniref:Gamma-glutamyl-gamma-aminobutyrate hydrolase family protein n=1 Tax=Loigolactobacillus binensis TaxID=2559922 RepID=A0ABW3EAT7_9LACO|nr:gamma-glutamyl-gamma-aminobutyrate hydrolase family protein [Loigolactobacillus binensis]